MKEIIDDLKNIGKNVGLFFMICTALMTVLSFPLVIILFIVGVV